MGSAVILFPSFLHSVDSHTLLCLSFLISESGANRLPWRRNKVAWGQQPLARAPWCLFQQQSRSEATAFAEMYVMLSVEEREKRQGETGPE